MMILDTDHCVAILRGRLDVRDRLSSEESLAITAITVAELTHGAARSARPAANLAAIDVLLSAVSTLPFGEAAARQFGALKAHLESAGTVVADLDPMIGSIALEYNSPLVTHNRKHFERITGLQLDDWL